MTIKNATGEDFDTNDSNIIILLQLGLTSQQKQLLQISHTGTISQEVSTSMFLSPISESELIQHISSFKYNCSSGHNQISTKLHKTNSSRNSETSSVYFQLNIRNRIST